MMTRMIIRRVAWSATPIINGVANPVGMLSEWVFSVFGEWLPLKDICNFLNFDLLYDMESTTFCQALFGAHNRRRTSSNRVPAYSRVFPSTSETTPRMMGSPVVVVSPLVPRHSINCTLPRYAAFAVPLREALCSAMWWP